MNKKITEFSLIELKALAYDLTVEQKIITNNLDVINKELDLRAKQPIEIVDQSEKTEPEQTPTEQVPVAE